MRKSTPFFIVVSMFLVFSSCNTARKAFYKEGQSKSIEQALPTSSELTETIFLIGDPISGSEYDPRPVLDELSRQLQSGYDNVTVAFLGNYLKNSLPKKNKSSRDESEKSLTNLLKTLDGYQGKVVFIPGNRDWRNGGNGGLKAVKRLEDFIEEGYNEKNVFRPSKGCGDPYKFKMGDDVVGIVINSQWWLQDWDDANKINKGCDVKSRSSFIEELDEIIRDNKNKRLVFFMHHPLYSNGNHGGKFSFRQHVFPLSDVQEELVIPLPIIGSLYPFFRATTGAKQDIANEKYQQLKKEILQLVFHGKNYIFVSGHDLSLQYHHKNNHHFIVSGSSAAKGFAAKGAGADFVHSAIGFSKLYCYKNGEIWLEFTSLDLNNGTKEIKFRKQIVPPTEGSGPPPDVDYPPLQDKITVVGSENYKARGFKRMWVGKQYRDAWAVPVEVPVVDLEKEQGGLIPTRKGGGLSSNSLRTEAENGKQYVLRSVDKDLTKVLPPELSDVRAAELIKDQASALHPYSAMPVAEMAKAIGIYHTNPKVVYMPHQKGLGAYNELFNEELYLFEERPSGNWEDLASFGNSKDIVGANDVIPQMRSNHNHRIDQQWVLKSRLFDIFIHDWDRHDDQWRWASFKEDGKTIYRPIPRDRDQAFYQFKGILPGLVSGLLVKKFRTFKHDLKSTHWQSFNARYFDRAFMNELEREDWIKAAAELKESLTDEVIENAFMTWPQEVYDIDGPITIEKLKARRDNLEKIVLRLYEFLALGVDIVGTDKRELFEVERLSNGNTIVRVTGLDKDNEKKDVLYERTFIKKETKEIRLYGLEGKDDFVLTGEGSKGIKVRIIGGDQKDSVEDNSKVAGPSKKTLVYDVDDGVKIKNSTEVGIRTSTDFDVNEYDREAFLYNNSLTLLTFGFFPDEGFAIGSSTTILRQGFRKLPYKSSHAIAWSFAPAATNAFNIKYTGDYIELLGKLDFYLLLHLRNPEFVNYFGLGNNTVKTTDASKFNWVKMERYTVQPLLKKGFASNKFQIRAGPMYEAFKVENVSGRVVDDPEFGITDQDIERRHYFGGVLELDATLIDKPTFPKNGISNNFRATVLKRAGEDEKLGLIEGSSTFYITFGKKVQATFATKVGAATSLGDVQFYQYPSLGNTGFLRGFRDNRFAGKAIFFHNTDLRLKLFYWKNRFMPGSLGLIGGIDYGKVFHPGDADRDLHTGYAVGIWYAPLGMIAIVPFFTISEEEKLFNLKLGFSF